VLEFTMHGRRIKVAFLSFALAEYSVRLVSALSQYADVLLLLPEQDSAPYTHLLDQSVNFQPFRRSRMRHPVRQVAMIGTLLQRIRRFNPDVIHLQAGYLWFNAALPLLGRYPLVVTAHDAVQHVGDRESQKNLQWLVYFGYGRADQLIVHAGQLKREVVDRLNIPEEIVHVIPHIALGDDMAQKHVQEDDHLILFFGRIWEYKGLKYLIRAEPLITARVPDVRIVIAGRGEDFARYRRMMVHPEKFIVYNEYVSDDKRAELFRQASVVVLPYIEASQSGVVPIAYTFAKPVVATAVGGLPEIIEHGRTGLLVPPRDEGALADAVIRLLQDSRLRRQLGANAKRKIDTENAADTIARQTLAV